MIDHKEILNGFMSEMQHYIRHNETKTDWGFSSTSGLCFNLETYIRTKASDMKVITELELKLKDSFLSYGFPCRVYPFEAVYEDIEPDQRYSYEVKNNLLYSNPFRLSFIENWKPL